MLVSVPAKRRPRRLKKPIRRCGAKIVAVNLGTYLVTRALLPSLRKPARRASSTSPAPPA